MSSADELIGRDTVASLIRAMESAAADADLTTADGSGVRCAPRRPTATDRPVGRPRHRETAAVGGT